MSPESKHPSGRVVDLKKVETEMTPELVELEPGGILEWKNHSKHCPHFEILFEGSSPAKPTDKLTGTVEQSVSIRMPEKKGEFLYKVLFKKKDGTPCEEHGIHGVHRVRTCPGGANCL
jgi:hypothetical protein